MERVEGAGGVGGYSETEVGLRDRDGGGGSSFGSIRAAEEAVVSRDAARLASLAVVIFWAVGPFGGGVVDRMGGGGGRMR